MVSFANEIEIPTPLAPSPPGAYDGTMDAHTFEAAEPGIPENPSRLIRTDQAWGVNVDWEMHGVLASFLNADFHIRAYLESVGPGPEVALPGADVVVNSLSVPFAGGQRVYNAKINVPAGSVPVATYKIVTLLQLQSTGPGPKYPIAGLVEGPVIDIFSPT